MKKRVYFNLHKRLFSVQEKVNGQWKVIGHTDDITLYNVTFKVSEAGRQRVLREKKKNVHAFVEGTLSPSPLQCHSPLTIRYNPYKSGSFTSGEFNVKEAGSVRLSKIDGKPTIQADFFYTT